MDIFDALREDHQKQRTLVELLVRTHGDSEGRQDLFRRLTVEFRRHAAAAKRHFYTALIHDDPTQEMAVHGIAEHDEIEDLLADLEAIDRSSPGWTATATRLRDHVHRHLEEEEERVVSQMADNVLTEEQRVSFASAYRAARRRETMSEAG